MSSCRSLPVLAVLLAGSGCTDAELYMPALFEREILDNRITVAGSVCAEGADDLRSYLKIMFIIDKSNSMNVTDPLNRRISAAQEVVMRFVEDPDTFRLRAGVEIAVLAFYGDVETITRDERGLPGFTDDGAEVLFGLTRLARTGSNTGYDKALAQAFLLLETDMARIEDVARGRSRYEVIFVSDGMPFPDNCRGEANSPTNAVAAVERIAGLRLLHEVDLTFHAVFASSPAMFDPADDVDSCSFSDQYENLYDSVGAETRALLQDMAGTGDGSFAQFDSGDAITFEQLEFAEARRLYGLSSFTATNLNARPDGEEVLADTDGDSLSDRAERLIGSDPRLSDSDGDGFSDGVEWRLRRSGFDHLDPTDAPCLDLERGDEDRDGLRDCEEQILGTRGRRFDSDEDGLPDRVEITFGTDAASPTSTFDLQEDGDGDGGTNADELRWHTDPLVDDTGSRARAAYQYVVSEQPLRNGQACYELSVSNIALGSTLAAADDGGSPSGTNRVMLYFGQSPYDDPSVAPIYRVACAEGRFVADRDLKMPAAGRLVIPPTRPSATYRPAALMRPEAAPCQVSVDQDCGVNALWCQVQSDGACSCEWPDGTPYGPCPACADGVDDDLDGRTDYPFDPDCFASTDDDEGRDVACANGRDDDGDGLADWPHDPGCFDSLDVAEADPLAAPACANGIDDDDDGAIDFPQDSGCYAASDDTEAVSAASAYACDDGVDNDGDGAVDLADPGCFDANDIDEDGPSVCFYCQRMADALPGQCDPGRGFCKPRSGVPAAGACVTRHDCQGAPCVDGRCAPCFADTDCDTSPGAGDGLCDAGRGWCLEAAYRPSTCGSDAACPGACQLDIATCAVDPYYACQSAKDCAPGAVCSETRGFCMESVFEIARCDDARPCEVGACHPALGWCLPVEPEHECRHDDECPRGSCAPEGHCIEQSFVFPEDFDPQLDCWAQP